jgi:hypothetical protein
MVSLRQGRAFIASAIAYRAGDADYGTADCATGGDVVNKEQNTNRMASLADDLQSAFNAIIEDSPTTKIPKYVRRLAAFTMDRAEAEYWDCKLHRPTYERTRDICKAILGAARARGVSSEWTGDSGQWGWMKFARENNGHMAEVYGHLPEDSE